MAGGAGFSTCLRETSPLPRSSPLAGFRPPVHSLPWASGLTWMPSWSPAPPLLPSGIFPAMQPEGPFKWESESCPSLLTRCSGSHHTQTKKKDQGVTVALEALHGLRLSLPSLTLGPGSFPRSMCPSLALLPAGRQAPPPQGLARPSPSMGPSYPRNPFPNRGPDIPLMPENSYKITAIPLAPSWTALKPALKQARSVGEDAKKLDPLYIVGGCPVVRPLGKHYGGSSKNET